MSDVKSVSVVIPAARGRRSWAKLNRCNDWRRLPRPSRVAGGNDLPGQYLPEGDEELLPGDALLEGSNGRFGWSYRLTLADADGGALCLAGDGLSRFKERMKAAGMPAEYLMGSGPLSALVRVVWAYRLGLPISDPDRPIAYPSAPYAWFILDFDAHLRRVATQSAWVHPGFRAASDKQ